MNCVIETLNKTRRSYVREQAYLPLRLPVRRMGMQRWVKWVLDKFIKQFGIWSFKLRIFLCYLFACLRNAGEYSIFSFIKYCFHSIFYSFKFYCWFLFGFKHPLFKRLSPALSVKEICSKILTSVRASSESIESISLMLSILSTVVSIAIV